MEKTTSRILSELMDRVPHCSECEFIRMYDYTYKNYYCDNEDRIDDMGKLSVENLIERSPEWCPLRESNGDAVDLIKMQTDITLTDKEGKLIEIKVPRPEYSSDIFHRKWR